MPDCTFATADLTTFARLDTLGLQVTGQFLEPDRAVLACRVIGGDVTWLFADEGVVGVGASLPG